MITIHGLQYRHPHSDRGVTVPALEVAPSQVLAILGPSGSGKSTFAAVVGGLLPRLGGGHLEGAVRIGEVCPLTCDRATLLRTVGVVFQDPYEQMSGAAETVEREIAFGLQNLGVTPDDMRSRVDRVLGRVGLTSLRERRIHELSGGQMQRVALASVLVLDPAVLILDEPVAWLDPLGAASLAGLVQDLQSLGHTVIWTDVSTHPVCQVASCVYALPSRQSLTVPEALSRAAELGLREPLFVRAARAAGQAPQAQREVVLEGLRASRG